jgi:hypothetical protein
VAENLKDTGPYYPSAVARLGADTYGFVAEWLTRLEADIGRGRERAR